MTDQLRLLTLNKNENGEAILYRLEKGMVLIYIVCVAIVFSLIVYSK